MMYIFNNFNPWWHSQSVPKTLIGKRRKILKDLCASLERRQMSVISGVRRVGKSTLMFQLIDYLLEEKKINPHHILYFSFDEYAATLEEILKFYLESVLKESTFHNLSFPLYFFFDEIQKLPDWGSEIKIVYDMYPHIKIVLSGSANLLLLSGSRESLAGRYFEYPVKALDYFEYLEFIGEEIDFKREDIYQSKLKITLNNFLKCGGFIEALNFDDRDLIKYFRDSIIGQLVFRDIPEIFRLTNSGMLNRLLHIWATAPGMYLDYKNLGNDLKIDYRTLEKYVHFTELSLLAKKLYNYSPNLLTSEKKIKKIYLSNTGFTFALSNGQVDFSTWIEQFWVNLIDSDYFFRSPRKDEVDIIRLSDTSALPIEIKMKSTLSKRDFSGLLTFLNKYDQFRGLLISKNADEEYTFQNRTIKVLPYWKIASIHKYLEHSAK